MTVDRDAAGRPVAAARSLAIFVYTLRSCMPPRRWAAVLAASPARCCSACSPRRRRADGRRAFANVAAEGIFGLVVPIAALVIGDAVLGAEVRPARSTSRGCRRRRRGRSSLGRWLGGCARGPRDDRPGVRAGRGRRRRRRQRVGPVARRRRPSERRPTSPCSSPSAASPARTAVWSLAFVFLVERLLGTALTGIAQLSPTWESRAVSSGWSTGTRPIDSSARGSRRATAGDQCDLPVHDDDLRGRMADAPRALLAPGSVRAPVTVVCRRRVRGVARTARGRPNSLALLEDEERRERRPWPAERADVAGRGTSCRPVAGALGPRRVPRRSTRRQPPRPPRRRRRQPVAGGRAKLSSPRRASGRDSQTDRARDADDGGR